VLDGSGGSRPDGAGPVPLAHRGAVDADPSTRAVPPGLGAPPLPRSAADDAPPPAGERTPWQQPRAVPEDFGRPSSARVFDFLLGGAVNGAVDRELGLELARHEPVVVEMARESRSFLRRAVAHLAAAGIDQFLDLGSGIPSMGNVHEVARRVNPAARVAYVDVDPVAAGHGQTLLAEVAGSTFTLADLRDVDAVLAAPGVRDTLDPSRPVGLCLFSVLQHVPDADDPAGIVRRYLDALAPGSTLALSHASADDDAVDMGTLSRLTGAYARGAMRPRSREEIGALLAGVELVEPGLGWAGQWRPDQRPPGRPSCGHLAAVGARPAGAHHTVG